MFERLPASHTSGLAPRDPALTFVSILIHASVAGILLVASWMALPEISLPRLRPVLVQPIVFSLSGASAQRLGKRETVPPVQRAAKSPAPDPEAASQPVRIPPELPQASPESPSDGGPAGDPSLGPGDPDGVPGGDPHGKRGATCVGEGCDPDGPVGAGPGTGMGTGGDSSEIFHPGIEGVSEPVILESSKILPRYPELARRSGVTGRVILEAVIQTDGTVASVEILREVPPRLGFGEAATEAVSHWRYRPGMQYGVPVAVYFTVTVDFALSR